MELFSKSFLFCLLLKQVVANGCELATRDQQYVRITCKLPKNFTLFDEQEFPRNHFRCSNQAELWVVCGDGQLRDIITGGTTQGRDMLAVFPPTIYTKLGSTFEFLKLIFEQNAMFEESVEERNQSSPISVNSTIYQCNNRRFYGDCQWLCVLRYMDRVQYFTSNLDNFGCDCGNNPMQDIIMIPKCNRK